MNMVIFDTEYTSWKGCLENGRADWQKEEIVQLAAIKVKVDTLEVLGEFNFYIRPKINPLLSDYFINLTGITNEKLVEDGVSFAEAYREFKQFVDNNICYSHGWSLSMTDAADGDVMAKNLEYNHLMDNHPPYYLNIAPWFKQKYAEKNIPITKQCSGEIAQLLGQGEALQSLGLGVHNALYDVYSILIGLRFLGFNHS